MSITCRKEFTLSVGGGASIQITNAPPGVERFFDARAITPFQMTESHVGGVNIAWQIIGGALPNGLVMSPGGLITGVPTFTTTGDSSVTIQVLLMDALFVTIAQDTRTFTMHRSFEVVPYIGNSITPAISWITHFGLAVVWISQQKTFTNLVGSMVWDEISSWRDTAATYQIGSAGGTPAVVFVFVAITTVNLPAGTNPPATIDQSWTGNKLGAPIADVRLVFNNTFPTAYGVNNTGYETFQPPNGQWTGRNSNMSLCILGVTDQVTVHAPAELLVGQGVPFSDTQPGVLNSAGPVTWSIIGGALPIGLGINAATGEISGTTADTLGVYNFSYHATDGSTSQDVPCALTLAQAISVSGTMTVPDHFARWNGGFGAVTMAPVGNHVVDLSGFYIDIGGGKFQRDVSDLYLIADYTDVASKYHAIIEVSQWDGIGWSFVQPGNSAVLVPIVNEVPVGPPCTFDGTTQVDENAAPVSGTSTALLCAIFSQDVIAGTPAGTYNVTIETVIENGADGNAAYAAAGTQSCMATLKPMGTPTVT